MRKSIVYFLVALTAIAGALLGYLLTNVTQSISPVLMAITAGGFIYIAASDLIPELHKVAQIKRSNLAFLFFIFGLVFMWLAKLVHIH